MSFDTLEELIVATADAVKSPERLTVTEAAKKYVKISVPGTYVGDFDPNFAPYLNEPADTLTSLNYTGMVFAAPARVGKTQLFFNWMTHTAICDPADMMIVNMTMSHSRDWSTGDLKRFIAANPDLKKRLVPGKKADNTYDKSFISGMRLLIKWPSITELSGKTIPRMWCNDYDRIDQNIDGQGNLFDLARKRTTTYKRFGMTVAEGSPGFPITDPKWVPSTPHEAPPCEPSGILGLYNRGDRRRRYWRCFECKGAFEPSFNLFHWPKSADKMESAEQVVLVCPHCGHYMTQAQRRELDIEGKWLKEGETWLPSGEVVGTPRRSDIASFWLKGPPAAFQDWKLMVLNYLNASEEYELTGDEESLKTTTNTDQGEAYLPKALQNGRLPEELMARAQDWGGTRDEPVVPHGVRFLVATIDVQKQAFVVQVHGVGVGGDMWIVDMFKVLISKRKDPRDGSYLPIRPDAYPEDWQVLVEKVLERTYTLNDDSGRVMSIKAVSCDMSGEAGVSVNAVNFWRWLRDKHGEGLHNRFQLVKGEPAPSAPLIRTGYPEATKKDRHSSLRGDVPVLFINSTKAKDKIAGMLGRVDPATGEIALVGGQVNFPIWAEKWFYQQLTAETRGPVRWENPNKKRNEAFDLLTYAYATCLNTRQVSPSLDHIRWQDPPAWAKEWDQNILVYDPNAKEKPDAFEKPKLKYDLSKLAQEGSN